MPAAAADFTTSQREALKAAPAHVFALVAGADSLTDKREWLALVAGVQAAQSHSRTDGLRRVRSSGMSAIELEALRQVAEALGLGGVE